jgi:ABC-type uncharacterized transport system ATPase subunit
MIQAPAIEVRDVYKSFKTVRAVRGIDLTIHPGRFFGFGEEKVSEIISLVNLEKKNYVSFLILNV